MSNVDSGISDRILPIQNPTHLFVWIELEKCHVLGEGPLACRLTMHLFHIGCGTFSPPPRVTKGKVVASWDPHGHRMCGICPGISACVLSVCLWLVTCARYHVSYRWRACSRRRSRQSSLTPTADRGGHAAAETGRAQCASREYSRSSSTTRDCTCVPGTNSRRS